MKTSSRRVPFLQTSLLLPLLLLLLGSATGDYCEQSHCENGATCVTGVGDEAFICICADGFTGDTCESTETGPCSPDPCQNDGTCEVLTPTRRGDVFSEYACRCRPGFEGVHCQINVDDCAGDPCKNGGQCRDLDGDFSCHCSSPYVGKQCQTRCISLLGLEEGSISQTQISASSVRYGVMGLQRWGPELARLNNQGLVNAWTSASYDHNPWIQVDLQMKMRLSGIISQGASRLGSSEFIKAFKISSSQDGTSYTMYRAQGQRRDQVFVGNVDNESTRTNMFDPPIVAQFVRIIPVICRRACTLRMELIGCELNALSAGGGCSEPLGMKSRLISDLQITSSSSFSTWGIDSFTWHPQFARLDKQGKTNAWSPATNNQSEWIQVDLEKVKRVSGIITQGARDFGVVQFVSVFKVAFSDDGVSWNTVMDDRTAKDQLFKGNVDNNSHKKNVFEPPFYARFVRLLPWEWHERITLRMELLGCDE